MLPRAPYPLTSSKCVNYKNVNERFIDAFHSVVSYASSRALQKFACKLAESAKIILLLCLREKKERPEREKERIEPVSLNALKRYLSVSTNAWRFALRTFPTKEKEKINKSFQTLLSPQDLERMDWPGFEPGSPAWQAGILNHYTISLFWVLVINFYLVGGC